MFCYNCGSGISKDSKFCTSCGAVQQTGDQQSTAPFQPVAADQPVIQPVAADQPIIQPAATEQSITLPVYPYHQTTQPVYPYQQTAQSFTPENQTPQPVYPYRQTAQPAYPYQQNPQSPYQPYQPYQPPQPPKKKMWWKIAIPAVCLVALISAGLFILAMSTSPLAAVSASIYNIGKEMDQRTKETPLEAFGILADSFESGSVTVFFQYSDRWEDTKGAITLHSDQENNEFALEAEISNDDFDIELELYINSERAAARVKQLDNNFYGFIYDSFKEDFISFARHLDLEQQQIDAITERIDFLTDTLNTYGESSSSFTEYEKLIRDFMDRAEVDSERVDYSSGGKNIKVRKVEITVTERMIIDFLNDALDLLENDDSIRAFLEAGNELQAELYNTDLVPAYNEMIREMRSELRSLERDLRGEMKATFYIGSGDRLIRAEVDFDFRYDGERIEFDFSLDFGTSAHDTWVFHFNSRDDQDRTTITITWDIKETSRGGETSVTIDSSDRWGSETVAVLLDWNDRGHFTLSFVEDRNQETLLSGVYTKIENGFRMFIDDPFTDSFWEESLQLEVSAVNRSGHIRQIDFINISEWGVSLIESLENLFINDDYIYTPPYLPPPVLPDPPPQPGLPPQPIAPPALDDLIGSWEFSHGDATYFFWTADRIEFLEIGEVSSTDSIGMNGMWTLDGSFLSVAMIGSDHVYHFTISIDGDTLVIIDSDGDIGFFVRIS